MPDAREDVLQPEFSLFSYLDQLQQQHGVKQSDFTAYRQYLTRKLHRLRLALKATHGRGRTFTQKEIQEDDVRANPSLILILLLKAEREWAASLEGEERGASAAVKKLAKAVTFSQSVAMLSTVAPFAPHVAEEAATYVSLLQGTRT